QDPAALLDLPIPLREAEPDESALDARWAAGTPKTVPLRDVAQIDTKPGPNQINRENGKRRIVVTANVRDRDLGSFVKEQQERVRADVKLPTGYWEDYVGTFEEMIAAIRRMAIDYPLTLVNIFCLLCIAFGSGKVAAI